MDPLLLVVRHPVSTITLKPFIFASNNNPSINSTQHIVRHPIARAMAQRKFVRKPLSSRDASRRQSQKGLDPSTTPAAPAPAPATATANPTKPPQARRASTVRVSRRKNPAQPENGTFFHLASFYAMTCSIVHRFSFALPFLSPFSFLSSIFFFFSVPPPFPLSCPRLYPASPVFAHAHLGKAKTLIGDQCPPLPNRHL